MRNDFAAFILTHGRPDKVMTYWSLRDAGYTGRLYLVVDDEDPTADLYRTRFGAENVLQFSKSEIERRIDTCDNFGNRSCILHARNACWDLAAEVGVRYFIQLDDDYNSWFYRFDEEGRYRATRIRRTMDDLLAALLDLFEAVPALTVALSQGGDHIGGASPQRLRRKAMNSFICDVQRPFQFSGTLNEDVTTYTTLGRRGHLFLTVMAAQLNQQATQAGEGGISDLYRKLGTYAKAFYSVMSCPSSVRVGVLGDPGRKAGASVGVAHYRIHHAVDWNRTAACILREKHRKGIGCA